MRLTESGSRSSPGVVEGERLVLAFSEEFRNVESPLESIRYLFRWVQPRSNQIFSSFCKTHRREQDCLN